MNGIVNLNVGGCLYTTTRSTLTSYPDSMLAAMFSGELDPSVRDVNGAYVIDRDGPIFRHVLNFLRQGRLVLPEDFKEWDQLELEADFYQVGALVHAVKKEKSRAIIAKLQHNKDATKSRKFEFIEIDESGGTYMHFNVKYIGSSETLSNLPGLLKMIISCGIYTSEIEAMDVVKEEGMVEFYTSQLSTPPNCLMLIFREILSHGFELKTAPCKMRDYEDGMKWTFLRKI